ncbi:IcmT/TraK family protein [Brucella sp.]|uniref:IcmT/TraK family protein n=1 Tax=Brucella sp. TaxID=52132 RepID=UPI00391717E5
MHTPSFFLLDAHCIFVLPLFLFRMRWWTFAVLLATVLSFAALRMFPYRLASAVRHSDRRLRSSAPALWRQ